MVGCIVDNGTATADEIAIHGTVISVFENWSSMKPEQNDALYLAGEGTVLFDVSPMQDIGWAAQKTRLSKAFAEFADFWIRPNSDLAIHCGTDLAWVTATWKAFIKPKRGSEQYLQGRSTFVLQKREDKWLVVHDHVSIPTEPN
jgi:ketosteroid isomerase-like protein